MSNKFDLLLLDLDGTVADTDKMIIETMYLLYDLYRNGNRTEVEKIYYFSGPPIKETLKNEFPDMDNEFIFNEFLRLSYDNYDKYVTCFPHVKETLINLKQKGVKIGIVTSKGHNATVHCLDVIGLTDLVDDFVGFEDVINPKPHPEGIIKLMERFSILNKEKVLYIGDNKSDYLTGKNADIKVGLVTWGPRKIDYSLTPDYWINDFKELEDIINGENL